jgi:hypothetical protein
MVAKCPAPSGRVERLSDVEYGRLQKLRQAVKDAETEIAQKHGARYAPPCGGSSAADIYCTEFRGQFLLIALPKNE